MCVKVAVISVMVVNKLLQCHFRYDEICFKKDSNFYHYSKHVTATGEIFVTSCLWEFFTTVVTHAALYVKVLLA